MRVLRVAGRDRGEGPFVLHDCLTVVRGLQGDARTWFIDAVGRLQPDSPRSTTGEIEVAGVVLPIEPESFELLGLAEGVDAVIDEERLLGRPEAEPDTGEGVRSAPADLPAAPGPVAADPVDSWFREPPADGDPPAPAGDERGGGAEATTARTPLDRRIAALVERRTELERLAGDIAVDDLTEVEEALAAWDAAPTGVPVEEAAALADAWRDLQKDLQGLEVGASPEEKAALAAVESARTAVAEAEAALLVPRLTDEQMARIEAAHAAHLEAAERVERRFGGGRARRQLADAQAEEERLLRRFGFETWVDYVISASKQNDDPDMTTEQAALEEARAELEVCLAELDAIPGAVGRRHRRARLREVEEDLSERIARVLGHQPVGDDVEAELRSVEAPYAPVVETTGLVGALDRAGYDVSEIRGVPERVAAKARQVVALRDQALRRRAELDTAVEAIGEALVVLEAAAHRGETEVPPMPPLPDMAEPPTGVVDGEDEQVAAPLGAGPDAEPSPSEGVPEPATDGPPVDSTGAWPLDREASLDDVHWSAMVAIADLCRDVPAGQLPVVFDDPFSMLGADECVELLSRLARLTDHVQMVVVTDRPEVAEWAEAIGPDHASVLEVAW